MKCIFLLISINADTTIKNSKGETAEMLSRAYFKKSIRTMRFESLRYLLNNLKPREFLRLPNELVNMRGVEEEAWMLMEQGRSMFSELPASFQFNDLQPSHSPAAKAARKVALIDELRQAKEKEAIYSKLKKRLPKNWMVVKDNDGKEYYYNTVRFHLQIAMSFRVRCYYDLPPSECLSLNYSFRIVLYFQ